MRDDIQRYVKVVCIHLLVRFYEYEDVCLHCTDNKICVSN